MGKESALTKCDRSSPPPPRKNAGACSGNGELSHLFCLGGRGVEKFLKERNTSDSMGSGDKPGRSTQGANGHIRKDNTKERKKL